MGEGLIRATLATVRTNQWSVDGYRLMGEDVVALFEAMPDRIRMAKQVQDHPGGRRWTRALQILRRAGLVKFCGGKWVQTHA